MKLMPGSERATPLHGHVKFVPSMRNWFSLVPEPNADTVVEVPLEGDVGEIPGGGSDEIEHANPSRRDAFEILDAEAGRESEGRVRRCATPLPVRRSIVRAPPRSGPPFSRS